MRLTINLATRIYINKRQLNLFIGGALLILVILLLFNARNIAADLGEVGRLNSGIALLEGKSKSAKSAAVPEKEYQALLERIKFANGIIERKSYDWLQFFDRLEGVVPDRVSVTSLEPSTRSGELKLTGIAMNFGALRKFVENLEGSGYFTDVYLVSQSDSQGPEGERGIGFTISCRAIRK